MFHPNAVGIYRLIYCRDGNLFSVIYTKRSGNWRYWYVVKVSSEMSVKCSMISCNFLLFARNLLNFIARIWLNICVLVLLNFFVYVWLNCFDFKDTPIFLILFERDMAFFLIFVYTVFFLLWGYTITIDGNVCIIFEI